MDSTSTAKNGCPGILEPGCGLASPASLCTQSQARARAILLTLPFSEAAPLAWPAPFPTRCPPAADTLTPASGPPHGADVPPTASQGGQERGTCLSSRSPLLLPHGWIFLGCQHLTSLCEICFFPDRVISSTSRQSREDRRLLTAGSLPCAGQAGAQCPLGACLGAPLLLPRGNKRLTC